MIAKDYSTLAKKAREASTNPILIYASSILNIYDELLIAVRKKRIENKTNINNRDNEIHELY